MTSLTWQETELGPTTMWVEGRTARDYESQGFVIVEYEPPPKWLIGIYSGRAKITKPGSECVHLWSPELAALHKRTCDAHSEIFDGVKVLGRVWKSLGEAHSLLFGEFRYHEELIRVEDWSDGPLEKPQTRIVAAIREIARRFRGEAQRRVDRWADLVEEWSVVRSKRPAGSASGSPPSHPSGAS